jgi:hypothetical protein
LNIFFAVAAAILYLAGFEVWGDVDGPTRALYFALAFWQTGLALGGYLDVGLPARRQR